MPRPGNAKRDARIKELYRMGLRNVEIARQLRTSQATVSRVLNLSSDPVEREIAQLQGRIDILELQNSLLAEGLFVLSTIRTTLGQSLFEKIKAILLRWPAPLFRERYANQKLELHTGYGRDPQR